MIAHTYRSRLRASVLGGLAVVAILVAACSSGGGATTAPSAAPSVAASAATTQVMGTGRFHDVDGTATGEAQLVVKPDGAYNVVLESFKIGAIAHTNVVLVSNSDSSRPPATSTSPSFSISAPSRPPRGCRTFRSRPTWHRQ